VNWKEEDRTEGREGRRKRKRKKEKVGHKEGVKMERKEKTTLSNCIVFIHNSCVSLLIWIINHGPYIVQCFVSRRKYNCSYFMESCLKFSDFSKTPLEAGYVIGSKSINIPFALKFK
jgi:hypothetical protein